MKNFISSYREEIALFTRLSVWIGGPIIPAVLLGKWLDDRYQTAPWAFLSVVSVAFVISMVALVKEASQAMSKIEKAAEDKKQEKKD